MIHPSAIIDPSAKIGHNVSIGAFTIIDANVTIGDNCKIDPHVWITNQSTLGSDNYVGFGTHIGGDPQDHSFDPATESFVKIGNHNTIREHVTINRSTTAGEATTTLTASTPTAAKGSITTTASTTTTPTTQHLLVDELRKWLHVPRLLVPSLCSCLRAPVCW